MERETGLNIKTLNLHEAFILYDILHPFFPDELPESDTAFVEHLVAEIVEQKQQEVYIFVVAFLLDVAVEVVYEMDTFKIFMIFLTGCVKNNLMYLCNICRNIGYGK